MKILFCTSDRPGYFATGPNAWIQRLIPDLRNNYQHDIETLFICKEDVKECPTLSFFISQNLPVHIINRDEIPYIADQVKAILNLIKEHDFKILVANLLIPAFYAARFLKPFRIPTIGVLHSNDQFYRGVIKKFIKGKTEDQLTSFVSVSNYIHSLSKTDDASVSHVIIPCGTPLTQKLTSWDGNTKLKVMYAGRLETTQKQILKLTNAFLKASKINSNVEFSIYGSGSQEMEVEALISDTDYQHNVYFKGSALPSEIQDIMRQHHIFTLMSDYEGMPIALMEAMACGLVPVCLHEESGISEIITNGENGFIVNDRLQDYQDKLRLLQENLILWQELSKKARLTILQKYSTDITHKQWSDLINTFVDVSHKKIKIPKRIKLEGELLYYGDNRKPSSSEQLTKQLENGWLQFKLFLRPRARIRSLFKNER